MVLRRSQSGIVLLIALIVLVAMTLSAIALVRSVDTGVLVAANLAFRQSATLGADAGVGAGRTWVMGASETTLQTDSLTSTSSYWANAQDSGTSAFNPLTYGWTTGNNSTCVLASCAADPAGNVTRYVVHRLCDTGGAVMSVSCVRPAASAGGSNNSSKGATSYGGKPLAATAAAYYRITVRVTGPRNTTSYTQTIIY